MQKKLRREQALEYHSKGRPGKIEVVPTKEAKTQRDLSLAYSPGVAEPCKEIHALTENVYKYTAKGNLVAVISNGTAVLGLGDIGPEASKPVMEGKGVLFKIFADIDVFDIEINEKDPEKFVQIVKSLEPTFGGINLEDIKAPECFYIEQQLRSQLKIPVMHDDQHGTAIISSAALLNALELQKKKIDKVKFVVNGAGHRVIDRRDPRQRSDGERLAAPGEPRKQRLGHHGVADPLRRNDEAARRHRRRHGIKAFAAPRTALVVNGRRRLRRP